MKETFFILFTLWLILNSIVVGITIIDYPNICTDTQLRRVELIMPGRQLGCWLAKPVNNQES